MGISIPLISTNIQKKYGIFSQYAQKFLKLEIKNISFTLERFFLESDFNLLTPEKMQKLKDMGIKDIGKNVKEGILISDGKYDYHISYLHENLNINILKPDSEEVYKHLSISNESDKYYHTDNFSDENIEEEISEILDFVNDKLFKAKIEIAPNKNSQQYIPDAKTYETISGINKTLSSKKLKKEDKVFGYIKQNEEDLIDKILEKLKYSQELYKKISDGRTKYKVRSAYKNYIPQPVTNKLGFKNIGENGENITLFSSSYKGRHYTAIGITNKEGFETKFVVSKENRTVQKNLPSRYVKSDISGYRITLTPRYYTQEEIDKSNLHSYLDKLNNEMDRFIEHTQNWLKQKEDRKLIRSNYNTATLEKYKDLLDNISFKFEEYRFKMRKYLRKNHKRTQFKIDNNISTDLTSTAVKFDKITSEGYDLRLSFPKVKDKKATQILVMENKNILNSFYIINNKLLRFKIKDLNDKIRNYDRNLYYYDNEYLKSSKLNDYLLLLEDKLNKLNAKLDKIRTKQLENKEKYHMK